MTSFRKHLLIGMAALSLGAGSMAAYADMPAPGGPGGADGHMGGPGMGDHARGGEQMKERVAKRLAEVHDKLKLNASQEKAWNTYMGKVKAEEPAARPDPAEMDKLTAPARMEQMLAHMKDGVKRMEAHLAATKDFYAVLTPEQKKIFDDEFRRGPGHHGGAHGGPNEGSRGAPQNAPR